MGNLRTVTPHLGGTDLDALFVLNVYIVRAEEGIEWDFDRHEGNGQTGRIGNRIKRREAILIYCKIKQ